MKQEGGLSDEDRLSPPTKYRKENYKLDLEDDMAAKMSPTPVKQPRYELSHIRSMALLPAPSTPKDAADAASQRRITCAECGEHFTSQSLFEIHLETHNSNAHYQCDKCVRSFTRRVHYETHLQSHDGINSHRCPYCARAFSMKGNLRRHIRIHTNEAPYECPICFQRFRRSDGLKGHVKRHEACGEGVPQDMVPTQAVAVAT